MVEDWLIFHIEAGRLAEILALAVEQAGNHTVYHDVEVEGLAELLGVSRQSVSKWENNIALPDITLVPLLANYFAVSIARYSRITETLI